MKIATITRNLRHYVQCARASQLDLQIFAVASALFHKYVQNRERSPSRELNDVINNHEIKQCRD